MISWFYGTPSQINKYSKLYTDQGMDVLVGQISLSQFIFSIKDVELFGKNIVEILKNNEDHYKEIFLHNFSAGNGMWGVTQRIIKNDLDKYGNIPNRIVGQVLDSAGPPEQVIVAVPFAMFPTNKFLQSIVTAVLKLHLALHRSLLRHYSDAINNVYQNMAKTPALLLCSKVDPIGLKDFNAMLAEKWRANGMNVTYKCFEKSGHVKHYQLYPEEYLKTLHDHWKLVKLLEKK